MVSMGNSLNGYVVFAGVALLVKYFTSINRLVVDIGFVLLVIAMLFINLSAELGEKCGVDGPPQLTGSVLKAVFFPWVIMVGGVVALIHILPGWKQPFSNTLGYLVVHIPGIDASGKLLALLPTNDLKTLIEENPSLLVNEFDTTNFDKQLLKVVGEEQLRSIDPGGSKAKEFKKVILLKELIAEFMWHVLSGSVALITSFNILMNTPCN
jgi:hypothetical protein